MIAGRCEVLVPIVADSSCRKNPLRCKRLLIEQFFPPFPQGTPQPDVNAAVENALITLQSKQDDTAMGKNVVAMLG